MLEFHRFQNLDLFLWKTVVSHLEITILNCTCGLDLFGLYILFSQYRSCDNTQEVWSFVLFIKMRAYKHEYACMHSFLHCTSCIELIHSCDHYAFFDPNKRKLHMNQVYFP